MDFCLSSTVVNFFLPIEAVIDDGMDPPYACQMGVCCTCRAMVHSGKVEMEEDEGLSDAELVRLYDNDNDSS